MLNRKLILLGIISCSMCMVCACTSEKNEAEKAADTENVKEIDKELEITEDFKYLYHEALDGETIETEIETSVQKEYKVERGEFVKRISEIGIMEYEDLYYEFLATDEAAEFDFHLVEGNEVKKGDLICTYKPVYNEIDILERTRDVELMETEYQAEYNSKKADITMAEYELETLFKEKDANPKEIEIKKLQIKKLKLIFEKFQETKEPIVLARKELNETIKGNNIREVYSTVDGYILDVPTEESDQTLYKGNCIATITKREKYHIEIEAREELDALKYGTEVKIIVEGGKDGKDVEMKGKVVAAPNILGVNYRNENTKVEIIDEPKGVDWAKPIKVQYEGQLYKDALKVPIEAVMTEKSANGESAEEQEYVYIKNGEAIYKSYIKILDKNNDYYRVSDGVSEGDTLVCFNK